MTAARAEDGQMRVSLAGLDLNSAQGARVALARIRSSADLFCEASPGRQTLERAALIDRCVGRMTRKAVEAAHAPLVAALLQGETPMALAQK